MKNLDICKCTKRQSQHSSRANLIEHFQLHGPDPNLKQVFLSADRFRSVFQVESSKVRERENFLKEDTLKKKSWKKLSLVALWPQNEYLDPKMSLWSHDRALRTQTEHLGPLLSFWP